MTEPRESGATVRRVLIYRLGSLGDTVVALPCFHLAARAFPQAERILLTNFPVHAKAPAAAAVLGGSGLIHGYMEYPAGTRRLGELLRLALRIRRFRPDVLVYLMPVRPLKSVERDRWFFRLAGVRRLVGLPTEEQLSHRFDGATGRFESEASRLARTLSELGDAAVEEPANFSLCLTAEERETARAALTPLEPRPIIACGPGTKMQSKDWGQDNWRSLLALLHARYPEHGLALVGAPEDRDASEFAALEWAGPRVNLCGRLTPRQSAAALERAEVFLGPDSGPMHLAASVGTPCVAAFSARALPGIWFPTGRGHQVIYHQTSCYGCNLQTCIVEERRCIASITVAEMAAAAIRVLDSRAARA
jgi:ADP-heptose:LPS heptosyltransferase